MIFPSIKIINLLFKKIFSYQIFWIVASRCIGLGITTSKTRINLDSYYIISFSIKKQLDTNTSQATVNSLKSIKQKTRKRFFLRKAFIDFTYLGKNSQSYLGFVEKTDNSTYPFVFRNRKELSVFVLNKRKRI